MASKLRRVEDGPEIKRVRMSGIGRSDPKIAQLVAVTSGGFDIDTDVEFAPSGLIENDPMELGK